MLGRAFRGVTNAVGLGGLTGQLGGMFGDITGQNSAQAHTAQQNHLQREHDVSMQQGQHAFTAEQANIDRQRADTAYQRGMADMREAGINPIHAHGSGGGGMQHAAQAGSQPAGGSASGQASAGGAGGGALLGGIAAIMSSAMQMKKVDGELKLMEAQTAREIATADKVPHEIEKIHAQINRWDQQNQRERELIAKHIAETLGLDQTNEIRGEIVDLLNDPLGRRALTVALGVGTLGLMAHPITRGAGLIGRGVGAVGGAFTAFRAGRKGSTVGAVGSGYQSSVRASYATRRRNRRRR